MKKILVSLLVAVAALYIIWYTIQTKPSKNIPNAGIENALPNVDEKPSITGPKTSEPNKSKQIDNAAVKVSFKGFGPGKVHNGSFSKVTSNLTVDVKNSVAGSISVDMSSLTTDTEGVTKHLKTDAFFDTTKYPTAEFILYSLVEGKAIGSMTIKGMKKDVNFPVTETALGYKATFNINMKEFGIDQKFANETIELTVEAPLRK